MYLLAQLFLTQFVESEELLRENHVLLETTTGELHPDDDASVRHHHGHGTEVDLQVLWQLLTPSVTRVLQVDESYWKSLGQQCHKFNHTNKCAYLYSLNSHFVGFVDVL